MRGSALADTVAAKEILLGWQVLLFPTHMKATAARVH